MLLTGNINEQVLEIERICIEHNYLNETVMPYGVPVRAGDLIDNWKGYDNCTTMSKEIIVDEMTGFVKILDKWLERDAEPVVCIKILKGPKTGLTKNVNKSLANAMIEDRLAILA